MDFEAFYLETHFVVFGFTSQFTNGFDLSSEQEKGNPNQVMKGLGSLGQAFSRIFHVIIYIYVVIAHTGSLCEAFVEDERAELTPPSLT